jgi:hypothetical protein
VQDRDRPLAGARHASGRSRHRRPGRHHDGTFISEWKGDILYGRNEGRRAATTSWPTARNRAAADETHSRAPRRILLWHANYHPDGGQLFFPLDRKPFLVPLALPGDDIRPEKFVCFRFDGSQGLYIHPNIWHEGVFATSGTQRFFDQQGAVHARVSVDFPREFGCLLEAPID